MAKILIIEDDTNINDLLTTILKKEHECVSAFSGTEGLLHLNTTTFDLVLLDLMLPGKTGHEVLAETRAFSQVPIIVLTAMTDKKTTTELLLAGANDYVCKPFDVDELLARVAVQLRTVQNNTNANADNTVKQFKNLTLDSNQFQAFIHGKSVGLSKKEFEILALLIAHPKIVYTKEMLYQQIWEDAFYGDANTINVHISKIRSKLLKLDPHEKYIDTVWGIGTKLATEEA